MARDLGLDELLDSFTLGADELTQLRNKSGATRLGFALTPRFLLRRGRFTRGRGEVPDNAIVHVAKQIKVEPSEIAFYDWQGRSAKRNRTGIRDLTGFGECSVADAEKVTLWLAENVCDQERDPDRVRRRLLEHCREELIEPPEKTRVERLVRSALSRAAEAMMARAAQEVPAAVVERMLALIGQASDDPDEEPAAGEGPEVCVQIKDAPGNVSLKTLIAEKTKLEAVRAAGVPHRVFARIPAKVVAAWRDRAAAEAPSHLRGHPPLVKVCLLGALLFSREREITDTLVDLVIATVHRINARAEKVVTEEFVRDLKRVSGKEDILFRIAEASVGSPGSPVREVVYPASGGEQTLQDLPADFADKRAENYRKLNQPLDPDEFIARLRGDMVSELAHLNDALPRLEWVEVTERKAGAISLSPLEARAEPRNLRRLKKALRAKWGVVPLSEDDLRYIRRRYFTIEGARGAARAIANATFAARSEALWGQGSTAVGSDSTHVKAFDQNLFTEWHSRYGGRGVLIYWHIEQRSMAVHSQLLSCSASEVHAMVEGAMRHGTSMNVEANYVDSHGQSELGFGITRLLGFKLLPRIKQINRVKLYQPDRGDLDTYANLRGAMTRPIRWDLIAQQYDQMIKYATAIRLGTASTEAILRRFTRNASHPAYAAMLEVGRAEKTAFCARYLRDRDLQYEVGSGLNVVENSHGIHGEILYGKTGELSSNRREEQELTMLALHILQACLVKDGAR